jgi:hypothetical protein
MILRKGIHRLFELKEKEKESFQFNKLLSLK